MQYTPEALPRELNAAILDIVSANARAERDRDRATIARQEADVLDANAQTHADQPIRDATEILIAMSSNGELAPRQTLEAVLLINQTKPSRIGWSGKADIERTLKNFDALVPDAPVLANPNNRDGFYGGIVTKYPVCVIPSVDSGLGGLPEAEIGFGIRPLAIVDGKPVLKQHAEIETRTYRQLAALTIGTLAIQELLHNYTVPTKGVATRETRKQKLHTITRHIEMAGLFNEALGTVIDLKEITAFSEKERKSLDIPDPRPRRYIRPERIIPRRHRR